MMRERNNFNSRRNDTEKQTKKDKNTQLIEFEVGEVNEKQKEVKSQPEPSHSNLPDIIESPGASEKTVDSKRLVAC
jgi:hypothetical protein